MSKEIVKIVDAVKCLSCGKLHDYSGKTFVILHDEVTKGFNDIVISPGTYCIGCFTREVKNSVEDKPNVLKRGL